MADYDDFNGKIIEEFRANGGRLGGRFQGADMLLLHHTGARTGAERISPLGYQLVGEGYAVFATKAGAAANPAWYHNLVANPDATIEVGADTVKVVARVAEPAERDVIWAGRKERVPQFAKYEETAAPRKIPVVVLDPVK
jgi:deazaflavin-dependent oxidoreductase (nitroreductase family)